MSEIQEAGAAQDFKKGFAIGSEEELEFYRDPRVPFKTMDELLIEIRPHILEYSDYLEPVKIQGREVTDWSAEGIKAFSLFFGISIAPIEIVPSPKNDGVLLRCSSKSIYTGQTSSVIVFQPFQTVRYEGKGAERKKILVDDIYWAEKGTTRVSRNARRNLLPCDRLKQVLNEEVVARGKQETQKTNLMEEITGIWESIAEEISPLTKSDCLSGAEEKYGERDEWDIAIWKAFGSDLKSWSETGYLLELRDTKVRTEESESEE